jgi:diguanylate cyclase (GGDEF)-like protein
MNEPRTTAVQPLWGRLKQHFREAFSGGVVHQRQSDDEGSFSRVVERRRQAYRYILLALSAVLTPICLHLFYLEHFLSAAFGFILLGVVFTNIWQLGRHREALFSPTAILAMTLTVILISVYRGQTYTLYWIYPLLSLLPLILQLRSAMWLGVVCGVLLLPSHLFDTNTAVVIGLSMALTWLISAWLIYAVTAQSRRLRTMADTDPLTGAYNRRFFQLQTEQALGQWQRNKRPASILLIDVDFFKRINDKFGHTAGDLVLKGLVELLTGRVRKVDTVCRYGGEEFAVLLPETDARGAVHVAEEIRALMEASQLVAADTVTISLGVCEVMDVKDTDHWVNLADGALYQAKKAGRNRVELATAADIPEDQPSLDKTVPQWR